MPQRAAGERGSQNLPRTGAAEKGPGAEGAHSTPPPSQGTQGRSCLTPPPSLFSSCASSIKPIWEPGDTVHRGPFPGTHQGGKEWRAIWKVNRKYPTQWLIEKVFSELNGGL
jgi:hypothetical protein